MKPATTLVRSPITYEKAIESVPKEIVTKINKKYVEALTFINLDKNDKWEFISEENG